MRLLHVYDHDYVRRGEAVYSTGAFSRNSWSRYLDAFGSVLVIANEREASTDELSALSRVDRDGVEFRFLPRVRSPQRFLGGLLGINPELERLVREADAVAVRLTSELGYQAVAFARCHGRPFAVEAVDCPWDAYTGVSLLGKLVAPLAWWRMRRALARAPFAIYVTERFLQRRYPSRGYVVAASNVALVNSPPAADYTARDRSELRIGMIGNCDIALKGHRVLLAAFAAVAPRFPSARLVFIGGGEREGLEREVTRFGLGGRVEFAGRVAAGVPMNACLDSLDVYAHPSFKEGLSRAVIEAMSRGRAVLASRAGGMDELLDATRLHRAGDAGELALQLGELLADGSLRERLGRENRDRARCFRPNVLRARRRAFWGEFAAWCERSGEV